jgi:hypothetical protein
VVTISEKGDVVGIAPIQNVPEIVRVSRILEVEDDTEIEGEEANDVQVDGRF